MAAATDPVFFGETMLCDGGMGTSLLARGAVFGDCLEELNLVQPAMVRSVHEEYLRAGARIIETNTFGANAFRLEPFGLRDSVRELNFAGAQLARRCVEALGKEQGTVAYVAGCVGPLATSSQTSIAEVRAAFGAQFAALAEGGVDVLIAETMMSLSEAEQAVVAARQVAPHLKIAVLMTCDEQGHCLDGLSAGQAASRLTEIGADAVGCNCGFGPASVLDAIERMRAATALPLIAMPNAGLPHMFEGRAIYALSPEEMAEFALCVVRAGANWVGGCCGTTAEHISAMRDALRTIKLRDPGEAMAQLEVA